MQDKERRTIGMYRIYVNIPMQLFLRIKKDIGLKEKLDIFISEAIVEKFESSEENYGNNK